MNIQIITAAPVWFTVLCLLAGAAVSAILYFRNHDSAFSRNAIIILALLRFAAFSIAAFLLLSPMVRITGRDVIKPTIIAGIDNSASMLHKTDSATLAAEVKNMISILKNQLGDDYMLDVVSFGTQVDDSLKLSFSESKTDIAAFLKQADSRYFNRNLGAVVLISDGIFNSGENPVYTARNAEAPVFTVKMGDTAVSRDLIISRINHNRFAYKGNRFPIEIIVHARELPGEKSKLSISHEGKLLIEKEFVVSSANQVITFPLFIEADETGLKKFRIAADVVGGEINTENNVRDIYIEVREMRQKIAIIAAAPHPDLAAFMRALNKSNNFEASLFMINDFAGKPEDYSAVIFHQLPSSNLTSKKNLPEEVIRLNVPAMFVLGPQSDIAAFNRLSTGISITGQTAAINEALPVLNNSFPLFLASSQLQKLFQELPPLSVPFANYQVSNSTYTMAFQGIGQLTTNMPLVAYSQTASNRYAFVAGEGLWKWRMTDYLVNGNHDAFDELVSKSVQYLAQDAEKGKFRIYWNNYYTENEPVEFSARLFNEADEPITTPEIELTLTNESGKEFKFSFLPLDDSYLLKIGALLPGLYSFSATTDPGTGKLTKTGSFVVNALSLEDVNTVADHNTLNVIAESSNGKSFFASQINDLVAVIKAADDIKPVVYERKRYTELTDLFGLLLILFILLGLEWFIRKYLGSY